MTDLRTELHRLAHSFVRSVLAALASAPLGELIEQTEERGPSRGSDRPGRGAPNGSPLQSAQPQVGRARRGRAGAEEQKRAVLTAAAALAPGFRKGDLAQRATGIANLSRILSLLVADGKLRREGDRKKARYSLPA